MKGTGDRLNSPVLFCFVLFFFNFKACPAKISHLRTPNDDDEILYFLPFVRLVGRIVCLAGGGFLYTFGEGCVFCCGVFFGLFWDSAIANTYVGR